MIDRAELRAMQIASAKLNEAFKCGETDTVDYAARQVAAIVKIRKQTQEIWGEYGVTDIEDDASIQTKSVVERKKKVQTQKGKDVSAEELTDEQMRELSFGSLSRYLRLREGISQREFARRSGTEYTKINRLERGALLPSYEAANIFIVGHKWSNDDPRAEMLRQRATQERMQHNINRVSKRSI